MTKLMEMPECNYPKEGATLITPSSPTPSHILYLSSLDDQPFLRFYIRYLFLYDKPPPPSVDSLKSSLSKVLVHYYPLAGRLRPAAGSDEHGSTSSRLEVDCNGQGALFAQGHLDLSASEFLEGSRRPNRSWRKLLYRGAEAQGFLSAPPLIIQVIHLNCGGMILCTAINHCLCDGIGTAQFLHAWSMLTAKPNAGLLVAPFHSRHVLKPRSPPRTDFPHPEFTVSPSHDHPSAYNLLPQFLQSQLLTPVSVTFSSSHILRLKKQCVPSFKCTSFEALAAHVWRSWARAMELPSSLNTKLLFSINVRKKLAPELPKGYYGNGFILGYAESPVSQLVAFNLSYGVRMVQQAKDRVDNGYIRSVIDLLEEKRTMPDLSVTLVISQWAKLGLEDLDFGEGRPAHMGPIASEIYCLFLPVAGDPNAVTVLMSVPQGVAERFESLLKGGFVCA